MRTLAIGDIHGCFKSLKLLESFVPVRREDRIVALGDYVDRGPDSRGVLQWLIERRQHGELIALRGNHEVVMERARSDQVEFEHWMQMGGATVLASYGTQELGGIPDEHWRFLTESLLPYYRTETHFFVHANVDPDRPLEEQSEEMLYWESFDDPKPHLSGRKMVCGHTPQREGIPRTIGHATCIDTNACRGGWLTCLDVEQGFCWQANESGMTRKFPLTAPP